MARPPAFPLDAWVNAGRELGPARAEIAPEGLAVTRETERSQIAWGSLIAVEAGPSALYLFTTPEQAHIIPRGAFADAAAFDAFVGAIDRYRRDA